MTKFFGDVIPSNFDISGERGKFSSGAALDDFALRIGEVQEVIYPEDKRNKSKRFIEYTVNIQQVIGGATALKKIHHCTLLNPFAGLADKAYWTLRGDTSSSASVQAGQRPKPGRGSRVLLLYINGSIYDPVIIGGLRDDKDDDKGAESLGHHLDAQFNGMRFQVNDDGEFTVTYGGKTNKNGIVKAALASTGSKALFSKDGSIELSTKKGLPQFIKLNNEDAAVQIKAGNQFSVDTTGTTVIKSGGAVAVSSGSSMTLEAKSAALKITGPVSISSTGVSIGDATDATMKGSTYRAAEKELHGALQGGLGSLEKGCADAAALLLISHPDVAAGFTAIALSASQMKSAIAKFENKHNSFLSTKNKSD